MRSDREYGVQRVVRILVCHRSGIDDTSWPLAGPVTRLVALAALMWGAQGGQAGAAAGTYPDPIAAPRVRVVPVGGNPIALAVDAPLGRIFVVSRPLDATGAARGRGAVSVLDAARGVVVCTFRVGVNPTDIAVDARARHVFVLNSGRLTQDYVHFPTGSVSVLDARDPRCLSGQGARHPWPALHTVVVGYNPYAVTVDERIEHAFVINGDALRVLDTTSGALLHTATAPPTSPPLDAMAVDTRRGEVVVTGYEPSGIHLFAAGSGEPTRTARVGSHARAVAVDSQTGRIFVADQSSEPGVVNVLDAGSGRVVGTTPVGRFSVKVVVDELTERAFVLNGFDDSVSVLDARTGLLLRTSGAGAQTHDMALDTVTGRLYVTTAAGLTLLDATSGAVLRTVALGVQPGIVAIDAHTGQVIVTNIGRNSVSILDAPH